MKKRTEKIVIFIFGVIFISTLIVIAIIFPKPTPFQVRIFQIVLALASAGIAASIPGVINIKISDKIPGAIIRASGAIAVFVIIYFFNPAQFVVEPTHSNQQLTVGISSSEPITDATSGNKLNNEISYKQNLPIDVPKTTILLQEDKRYYLCQNIIIPLGANRYEAKIRRPVISPRQGTPGDPTELCFTIKDQMGNYKAYFIWDEKGKTITKDKMYDLGWVEFCDNSIASVLGLLFTDVYAADNKNGWIVPSLKTLIKRNKQEGMSFTRFKITSTMLKSLKAADKYTYSIFVNNTPIYIDGWSKDEIRTNFYIEKGITLEFGLEDLNFSGADYGKENIRVSFYFYSDDNLIKQIDLDRSYVALREVSKKVISSNDYSFDWEGEFVLGKKQDGYEVFIWSSENKQEILQRKNNFDRVSLQRQLKNSVSVIRPPLNDNKSYGLVIGFYDNVGRIEFTFSFEKARQILKWVKEEVAPLKIARRDSRIYPLLGN